MRSVEKGLNPFQALETNEKRRIVRDDEI